MKCLALATALIVGTGAASAAVVTNGGFEQDPGVISQGIGGHGRGSVFSELPSGKGRSWGIWTSGVAGWSTDVNGIEFQTKRTLGPDFAPSDGDYYVELDTRRNSRIYQDVTLDPGLYKLSFDYAPRVNSNNSNAIGVTLDGYVDELISGSYKGGTRVWTNVSFDFEVISGSRRTRQFQLLGRFAGQCRDLSCATARRASVHALRHSRAWLCGPDAPPRLTFQLLRYQLVDGLRVRFATSGFHNLPDKPASQLGVLLRFGDLIRIVCNDLVNGGLKRFRTGLWRSCQRWRPK